MPESNALRSPHQRWLAGVPFRRKLALIVGVPSAVALLGSLLAVSRVSSAYRRSHVLEQANASSSSLIQAAAAQAKERGFTSAALSDPGAQAARRAIATLRENGDRSLNAALSEARDALRGNAVLAAAQGHLQEARHARDLKRAEVDATLARGQGAAQAVVQDWFDTQTRLIQAERVFGGTLFLAQNPYELVIQYNGFIKANVFVASEFAGRERARIGRFIAQGKPIPAERLEELQRWRGVVEENLAAIAQLRANPAMSPAVLQSIDAMEGTFLGEYEKVRDSVYTASARGETYPLTTDAWIAASTRGIDSILAVSERISEEAARVSRQQAAFSLGNVALIVGMMGLLALAVVASLFVARQLSRRLGELRAAAERVSRGDYTQPVGEASTGGEHGDEFAELAGVFNTMQHRVQAGVEQLQAEKAQVEVKVAERTRELSEANARLQSLNAEKDNFLGICSHDLKNPLSGIIGLADLLEGDADDPAQVRSHAADILQSAEFMFQLVGNLLDVGAIEQGKFPLVQETFDLGALVVRSADSYRRQATDKRIRLDAVLPAENVLVRGDARATLQVANNLISNALKFTPLGGTVTVTVGNEAPVPGPGGDPATRGRARFSVRDTGPGLSPEDQSRLFQKYVRLSPRSTAGEHSTGLGLSIVKQLVEAMAGTVRCESDLGHGTVFTVEIPMA